ncbi:carbohydrate kinase family protein [Kytococcus sp. Marseille-QA3725]
MTPTPAVLVVGEALVDLVDDGHGSPTEHVGGSPANVAMGLARLDHEVLLATHLGDDERGALVADAVRGAGVGLTPASTSADRTSTATAVLDPTGAAEYVFDLEWRYDAADTTACAEGSSTPVGHLHTGSLGTALEPGGAAVVEHLRALRGRWTVSYDPNARPGIMADTRGTRARVEEICTLADVVKCSDEDLAWFYPDRTWAEAAAFLVGLGPRLLVVTRGGEGATALRPGDDGTLHRTDLAAPTVEVVDTVGAGDSFMAGLLSGLLEAGVLGGTERAPWGDDVVLPALRRALATGAWTVQRAGAGGPTRGELT